MERTHLKGTWQQDRSFSPCVLTKGGTMVWTAGHGAPADAAGNSLAGDFDAQVHGIFAKLEKTLEEAGATLSDIVSMTVFITDVANNTRFVELRKQYFANDYPASTLVTVAALNRPEMMVEIQAVAVTK